MIWANSFHHPSFIEFLGLPCIATGSISQTNMNGTPWIMWHLAVPSDPYWDWQAALPAELVVVDSGQDFYQNSSATIVAQFDRRKLTEQLAALFDQCMQGR